MRASPRQDAAGGERTPQMAPPALRAPQPRARAARRRAAPRRGSARRRGLRVRWDRVGRVGAAGAAGGVVAARTSARRARCCRRWRESNAKQAQVQQLQREHAALVRRQQALREPAHRRARGARGSGWSSRASAPTSSRGLPDDWPTPAGVAGRVALLPGACAFETASSAVARRRAPAASRRPRRARAVLERVDRAHRRRAAPPARRAVHDAASWPTLYERAPTGASTSRSRRRPDDPRAWDAQTVADAAFARYVREATDCAGGRARSDEIERQAPLDQPLRARAAAVVVVAGAADHDLVLLDRDLDRPVAGPVLGVDRVVLRRRGRATGRSPPRRGRTCPRAGRRRLAARARRGGRGGARLAPSARLVVVVLVASAASASAAASAFSAASASSSAPAASRGLELGGDQRVVLGAQVDLVVEVDAPPSAPPRPGTSSFSRLNAAICWTVTSSWCAIQASVRPWRTQVRIWLSWGEAIGVPSGGQTSAKRAARAAPRRLVASTARRARCTCEWIGAAPCRSLVRPRRQQGGIAQCWS